MFGVVMKRPTKNMKTSYMKTIIFGDNMIQFKHQFVPSYVAAGQHSRFIMPVAQEFCKGKGLDIGCNRPEWAMPGARPIDLLFNDPYDAYNLPNEEFDYIFSSHCLEHLEDYDAAIVHWTERLKTDGTLFLYLPHPDCLYWQPNEMPTKRHIHTFTPLVIRELLHHHGYYDILYSDRDLAYSFAVTGKKL